MGNLGGAGIGTNPARALIQAGFTPLSASLYLSCRGLKRRTVVVRRLPALGHFRHEFIEWRQDFLELSVGAGLIGDVVEFDEHFGAGVAAALKNPPFVRFHERDDFRAVSIVRVFWECESDVVADIHICISGGNNAIGFEPVLPFRNTGWVILGWCV